MTQPESTTGYNLPSILIKLVIKLKSFSIEVVSKKTATIWLSKIYENVKSKFTTVSTHCLRNCRCVMLYHGKIDIIDVKASWTNPFNLVRAFCGEWRTRSFNPRKWLIQPIIVPKISIVGYEHLLEKDATEQLKWWLVSKEIPAIIRIIRWWHDQTK